MRNSTYVCVHSHYNASDILNMRQACTHIHIRCALAIMYLKCGIVDNTSKTFSRINTHTSIKDCALIPGQKCTLQCLVDEMHVPFTRHQHPQRYASTSTILLLRSVTTFPQKVCSTQMYVTIHRLLIIHARLAPPISLYNQECICPSPDIMLELP